MSDKSLFEVALVVGVIKSVLVDNIGYGDMGLKWLILVDGRNIVGMLEFEELYGLLM